MDFDKLAEALRSGETVKLTVRHAEIKDELVKLDADRTALVNEIAEIEAQMAELIGLNTLAPNGSTSSRKCALCGEVGHIIARTKTADGNPTCKIYPNGKPKE